MPGKSPKNSRPAAKKPASRPAKPAAKKPAAKPAKPVAKPTAKLVAPKPATVKPAAAKVSPGPSTLNSSSARASSRKPERPARIAPAAPEPRDITPSDPGLTAKEVEGFKEMLLEKRAQLVGDMTTMRDEALRSKNGGDLSTMPIHMADLGTDNFEQEFTLGLIEGGQQELREIDAALERIEKGHYGLCQATGKPIGKARLKAQPWARYCYEYMLAQERGQMRRY